MPLYPLKFVPRLVEKIWGGRRLEDTLKKPLPPGKTFGESWEIYDFPPGVIEPTDHWVSSVIANGPLAGKTLHWAIEEFGADLYGDARLAGDRQFPVLIKFLDARENLSLQVHPSPEYAASHPQSHLKTEAWHVVDCDESAQLYRGLKPGVTHQQFRASIADGSVMDLVNAIPVKPGQTFFLPSGTVHALGAGILVAEVQTPSDTTFRVWDFARLENGKPRKLHIEEALASIDFSHAPETPQRRDHVAGFFTTVSRLVTCDYFKIEKVRFIEGIEEAVPYNEPVVWMMLRGQAQVKVDDVKDPVTFGKGDTVLIPAKMKNPVIKTLADCVWLEVTTSQSPAA